MSSSSAFVAASIGWLALIPLATFLAGRASPQTSRSAMRSAARDLCVGSSCVISGRSDRFICLGLQMPVCARCTGIYAGAALSGSCLHAGYLSATRVRRRAHTRHSGRAGLRAVAEDCACSSPRLPAAATLAIRVDDRRHARELDSRGERPADRRRRRLDRAVRGPEQQSG